MTRILLALMVSLAAVPAAAQSTIPPLVSPQIDLSGPRFGWTYLSPPVLSALADRGQHDVANVVSQFGWQFERRFYVNSNGLTALHEFIPMVAGLDQGMALPSLTYMVGFRTAGGAEFGAGPNFSAGGSGFAVASGLTLTTGALNVPLNVAVVTSKSGVRVSFLTGFNFRRP
jgi:hypothetical protein